MDNEELEVLLLAGKPVPLYIAIPYKDTTIKIEVGRVYPRTLSEMLDIGIDNYNRIISMLCIDKDDIKKIDAKEDISTFEFIIKNCVTYEEYTNLITKDLSFIFNEEVKFNRYSLLFYLGKLEDHRWLYKDNYEEFKDIILRQHFQKQGEEEKPIFAYKKAEEMWEKMQKKQKKLQEIIKSKNNLPSIISGVAWKSGIGIDRIWNLTIYQLYDAYMRLGLIDEVDKTLNGIFAGTIDKDKVDKKELDWAKIIKINN